MLFFFFLDEKLEDLKAAKKKIVSLPSSTVIKSGTDLITEKASVLEDESLSICV